jgi:hypothetical protein
MKWNGRNYNRHVWFAWYPIKTEENIWVWLEPVERYIAAGLWSYKLLPEDAER